MLKEKGIALKVTDEARSYLAKNGYDDKNGARPIERLVSSKIEDIIAEAIIKGNLKAGDICAVGIKNRRDRADINKRGCNRLQPLF